MLCLVCSIALAGGMHRVQSPLPNSAFEKVMLSLKMDRGKARGFYLESPGGTGAAFYFPLVALRAVAKRPEFAIDQALDAYLRNVDKDTGLVQTLVTTDGDETMPSDSDASAAAAFAMLACDYAATPEGRVWMGKHLNEVKRIVELVIFGNQNLSGNSEGLVKTLSGRRGKDTPTECRLMDCCEVYGALVAMERTLGKMQAQASVRKLYQKRIALLAKGIAGLYSEKYKAFYVMNTEKPAEIPFAHPETIKAYPNLTAQVFPQLYAVPLGDSRLTKERYDAGWKFLLKHAPKWPEGGWPDPSINGFPDMFLGYVAAIRGDRGRAMRQIRTYDALWQQGGSPNLAYRIEEMGFRIRAANALASP